MGVKGSSLNFRMDQAVPRPLTTLLKLRRTRPPPAPPRLAVRIRPRGQRDHEVEALAEAKAG